MNIHKLSQKVAAELLGVTDRTLRSWTQTPRNSDGSYPGPALLQWAVDKASPDGDYDSQRERLAAAQAEKVEMENAVRRGQLADMNDVVRTWENHIAAARAKLLVLPSKLAASLAGVSDPAVIASGIRAEVYAALAELAVDDERKPEGDG